MGSCRPAMLSYFLRAVAPLLCLGILPLATRAAPAPAPQKPSITAIAWSHNGKQLAYASMGGALKVVDIERKASRQLSGPSEEWLTLPLELRYQSDDRKIACSYYLGRVSIHDSDGDGIAFNIETKQNGRGRWYRLG